MLVAFFDELQKLAKDAFGKATNAINEQFIYAKMLPHLKKTIIQVYLENGTHKQIVTHLEKDLGLNGLEASDELPVNTVTHNTENTNADWHTPTCLHFKKPTNYRK